MTGSTLSLSTFTLDPWADKIPPADYLRLARLTSAWLGRRAASTQLAYRRDLQAWLVWCERTGVSPLEARMADTDAWIASQREPGPGQRPAAESSIARRVAAVSSWYSYLIRNTKDDPRPLVTLNAAETDARPKVSADDSATTSLSVPEANRLVEAADADSPRSSALIRLLLLTGLRIGSVIAARIEDLGHDRGHRVLRHIQMKGRKFRQVPLPPTVSDAIDAMLEARGNPETGPLFATRTGRPISQPQAWRTVQRLALKAGLEPLPPHGLRHTFATTALDLNVSLRDLQDAMGHADPRTTRRYDRSRHNVDRHPAHVLATKIGTRP